MKFWRSGASSSAHEPSPRDVRQAADLSTSSDGGPDSVHTGALEFNALEAPDTTVTPYAQSHMGTTAHVSSLKLFSMSSRRIAVVSTVITFIVLVIAILTLLSVMRVGKKDASQATNGGSVAIDVTSQDVSVPSQNASVVPPQISSKSGALLINGDIIGRGDLQLTNGSYVTALKPTTLTQNRSITLPDASGTICLDGNNCNFATQADLQATNAQLGQASAQLAQLRGQLGQIVIPTAPVATTLNGLAGAISIQGTTNQVSVTTVNGVISLAAPQDIAPISSPTFAGLLLTGNFAVNGTVTLPLDCTGNLNGGALTTNASGQIVCSDDDSSSGGGGAVTTPGGTAGTIAMFTAAQTIADSLISQALGTVTIGGNAAVTGSLSANALTLTTALSVPNGGTGATSFTANGVVIGNGAGALATTAAPAGGQVLLGNAGGVPTFTALSGDVAITGAGVTTIQADSVALGVDTTGDYVASLGTLTGLSVTGNSGEGSTPNLSVVYGSTANTAVAGNTTVTLTAGNGLGGGGVVTLGTGGSVSFTVAYGAAANTAVQGNVTLTCPTGSGNLTGGGNTITLGTGGSCNQLATVNNPTFATSVTSAQLNLTGAGATGTLQVANLGQATTYTLPDPGAASASICLSTGNCAGSGGGVTSAGGTTDRLSKFTGSSSIGDSSVSDNGSLVTITGTANLVVQGGNATMGTLTQAGTLLLSDGSSNTVSIVASGLAADRTYTLPDAGGPATFCLSTGNCVGGGGGGSAPNAAAYIVATLDGTLTNERALAAGSNINITDGGANASMTVATVQNPNFTTSVTTPILQSSNALTISSAAGTIIAVDAGTTIELQDSVNVTGDLDASGTFTAGTGNAFQINSSGAITAATGITSSGTIRFSGYNCTGNANGGKLTTDGSGNLTCADDNGGAGSAISGSGTNGTIPLFNGAQTITDSVITQSGSAITITGTLAITNALTVANGGTGATSFTGNGVVYGNGAGALQVTSAGTTGQCLLATTGAAPAWGTCTGVGSGVTSLNGLTGGLTVANASASGSIITIDDASNAQKGIASFNSTNFTVSSGAVNTVQNINSTATPTFAAVSLTGAGTGLAVTNNATIGGALGVTGNLTAGGLLSANAASITTDVNVSGITYTDELSVTTDAGIGGTLNVTGSGGIIIGDATTSGLLSFRDGTTAFGLAINTQTLSANRTVSLPDADGVVCLVGSSSCGFAGSSGSGSYIQNQNASDQTANFRISGIGRANTALQAPLFDTATAAVLAIGTTNATAISLAQDATVAANKFLRLIGGNTASRPASPTEGMVYYDTTTHELIKYNGTKWVSDHSAATKIVAASDSSQALKDAADYVATGTGDQATINTALTAAAGGTVYLVEGTYSANATISIPNNTTLAGAGKSTLIQLADIDATDNLIENSDTATGTGVVIRDMQLDGQQSLQTGSITQNGIALNHMGSQAAGRFGARLENLYIKDFHDAGMFLDTSENNTITNTTFYSMDTGGSAPAGVYSDSSSNNSYVGNTFLSNYWGLRLDGSGNHGTTITGNVFRGNSQAAVFNFGAVGTTITSNTFDANVNGVNMYTGGSATVSGNTFYANTGYSVFVDDSSSNTITGNRIQNSGNTTDNNAIYIQNNSDSNTITSNTITDSSATTTNYAIRIASAGSDTNYLSDNSLGGGTINDSGTGTVYGGQLDGSSNLQLRGMTGINIQGTTTINTTGTGTTTIGNTTGALTLQGGGSVSLASSNGSNSTTLGFTGAQTAGNVAYDLNRAVTAGTYEICTTAATAACTAVYAAGSGGGNYIQNQFAGAQSSANFWVSGNGRVDGELQVNGTSPTASQAYIKPSASTNRGLVIQGTTGQTADLLNLYNSSGNFVAGFNAGGALYVNTFINLGTTTTAGQIILKDGTVNNYGITLSSAVLGGNRTYTLPNSSGSTDTICLQTLANCGSGSGSYIQNQNASAQTSANFWIDGSGRLDGNTTLGDTSTDRLTINSQILGGSPLVFQGATDNAFATTIQVSDPTANRTITLANASGTIALQTLGSAQNGLSAFVQGGSSWATAANLGTTDSNVLNFLTNNAMRLTVNTNGDLVFASGAGNFDQSASTGTFATGTGAVSLNGNVVLAASKSLTVTGGNTASRPASPTEGMVYYDTTTHQLLTYNNSKWVSDRTDAIIVAASNSSQTDKDAADYVADGNTGAANDGDQVQINAALTAAAGKKVVLLAGTYTADATILIPNNTTLTGVGKSTLIQLADIDATDNLIENSDQAGTATGLVIRDLSLDGNKSANTGAITQNGIYFVGGVGDATTRDGVTLENLWISNFETNGIEFHDSVANSKVIGVVSTDNDVNGMDVLSDPGSINSTITTSRFQNNGNDGLRLAGWYNWTIANNVANNNVGRGFYIASSYATITGNTANNNTSNGFSIADTLNSTITANTANGNGFAGIQLTTSNNNTVSGNTLTDNSSTADNNGISITTSDSNTITGNTITDSAHSLSNYAITITNAGSDTNYLSDNSLGGGTINDSGTGTVYGGQTLASAGDFLFRGANSATAFRIQNAAGTSTYFNVDSSTNAVTVANATINLNASSNFATNIGNTTGTLALQGGGTVTLGSSNGTNGTNITFFNTQTAGNINYRLDRSVAAGNYEICTTAATAACTTAYNGGGSTLQVAYANSGATDPQIQLSNANGGLKIRDAASSTIGNLLQIQNSTGATTYLGFTTSALTLGPNIDLTLSGTTAYISNTQTQTDSEAFGAGAVVAAGGAVAVGHNAYAYASGVAIGDSSSTGSSGSVAIGQSSDANWSSVSVGFNTSSADYSVAIGNNANTSAANNAIAIGASATTTAANQLVVGGSTSVGTYINNAYIGSGVTDATPQNVTLQGTGGSGSNVAGASFNMAGGRGTGTGTGGNVNIQVAKPSGSSGSSLNSLATVAAFSGVNGSALFKNSADSTAGFNVQNSSSQDLLSVDTTNSKIMVGDGHTSVLLVNTSNAWGSLAVRDDGTNGVPNFYLRGSAGKTSDYMQVVNNTNGVLTSIGGTGNVLHMTTTNSASAFQIQNASSNNVFSVDTSSNNVVLGKASTITGNLQFANSGGANLVAIQAQSASAAYVLQLPTAIASSNQCLMSGTVSGSNVPLTFGSCASGSTLQTTYDNDTNGSDTIIALTTADDSLIFRNPSSGGTDSSYVLTIDQLAAGATGGLDIQSAGTGSLLRVRDTTATAADVLTIADGGAATFRSQTDSTTAFRVQNAAGTTNLIQADTTTGNVGIGFTSGSPTYRLDIVGDLRVSHPSFVGDYLTLEGSGSDQFLVVNNNGWLQFHPLQDSQYAVDVRESGGTYSVFAVDTQNGRVSVGRNQPNATLHVQAYGTTDVASYITGLNVSQSADLLQVAQYDGAANVLSITTTGATLFKNNANSTTAFQVQTSGGARTLVVDTSSGTNGRVGIGLSSATVPSADLTFGDGVGRTINVLAQTVSNTAGNNLTINSGAGNGTGAGGALTLQAGDSGNGATGNGGALTITGGNAASTNGSGGAVSIAGGARTGSGTVGVVNIQASVNGATNINTGTSTGNVTIGNNSNTNNAVNIAAGTTGGINLQAKTTVTGDLIVSNNTASISGTSTGSYKLSVGGAVNASNTGSQYGIQNDVGFNPSGASLSSIYGMSNSTTVSGSALNIGQVSGIQTDVRTGAGYTGTITEATGMWVGQPVLAGTNKIATYNGVKISGNTDNGGNTTGTIDNNQLRIGGNTTAAGVGGTLNNYGINLIVGSGNTSGTNNYGLYIQGSGGVSATSNYAIYSASSAASLLAGALSINGDVTLGDTPADLITVNGILQGGNPLVFEGSSADANETTFVITNPTVDRSITFPDASGTVLLDPLTTNGDLVYHNGTAATRLARGSNGQCLTSDATTILWGSCASGSTLQTTYDNDTNGSDTIIALTTADDSLIFRNPSSGGTDSSYVLTIDQLAAGATGGLDIQSAGTGSLLRVRDTTATAADVLTIADGGAATFRSQTNSSNAFNIQNASADNIFTVNSSTRQISMGTSSANAAILQYGAAEIGHISSAAAFDVKDSGGYTTFSIDTQNHVGYLTGDFVFFEGANRTMRLNDQSVSNTAGNNLTVMSGKGNGTGSGGSLVLQAGSSGAGATGNGGVVNLYGGNAAATNGSGGNVIISGGTKSGSGSGGSVIIKPQASNDSTTAFQVQDAAGTELITADTTAMKVTIEATSSGGPSTVFSDGFESNNYSAWSGTSNSPTVQSTTKYTGTYAARFQNTGGSGKTAWKTFGSSYSKLKASARIYVTSSSGNYGILSLENTANEKVYIFRDSSGNLTIYNEVTSTTSSTASSTLGTGAWHLLELEVDRVNDVSKIYLDSSLVLSFSDDLGTLDFDTVQLGDGVGSTTSDQYYDDVTVTNDTTTYSGGELVVEGKLTINAPTQYTQRLCHNQSDGATTNMTLGDCSSGGADLAEYYRIVGGVEPGDLIASATANLSVGRTTTAYQPSVMGIISTNPLTDGIMGATLKDPSRQPVALSGRVPLKVWLGNGDIHVGDPLTASNIPGVAMKATAPGRIIGFALEDYTGSSPRVSGLVFAEEVERSMFHADDLGIYRSDPTQWVAGVGKIMILTDATYHDPTEKLQGLSQRIDALQAMLEMSGSLQPTVTNLNVTGSATIHDLTVSGQATLATLTVTGSATVHGDLNVTGLTNVGTIRINGHIITSGETPVIQALGAAGSGSSVVVAGNDVSGTITITIGDGAVQPATEGALVSLTFHGAYTEEPQVQITPVGYESARLQAFVDQADSGFEIGATQVPQQNMVYKFNYQVMQ